MAERIDPKKYREQVREDIEERQRPYRRPRPTSQERQQLRETIERSRPDLMATMPAEQFIKIFKRGGGRQDLGNIQEGSLIMPDQYTWAITREEEITIRLFMSRRGPRKIRVFVKGSLSDRPREEEHFLAEVLAKKGANQEEQTVFKVSPPPIGQIEAGQVIAIRPEIAERFGYWQYQDGQTKPLDPKNYNRQKPRNLKLSGF
ncbi:MAG: hypothetical protein PHR64_02815 [Candidatus Shapirobacteria bacterium]|nr:hypothetical protein [Candidatus Shapirobacteria bacterium]MDD5481854.1 hypothetical protein [Candidatus Shapirobacteria bacterium]